MLALGDLIPEVDRITLEDLNVKGLVRNCKLVQLIADAGFGMLRQCIEYKGYLRGCAVELVDRLSPSSLDVPRLQPIS